MRCALARTFVVCALGGCGRLGFDPVGGAQLPGDGNPTGDGAPTILVFRDDLGGYDGTVDTILDLSDPDRDSHLDATLLWHDDSPAVQSQQHALLHFDLFFGSQTIPAGADVRSATLTIFVTDAGVDPNGTIDEVAFDWASTVSWNTFGASPGVQVGDVRGIPMPAPTQLGEQVIDVTASVRSWVADNSRNNGWIISPAPMNGNACSIVSSEGGDLLRRPTLTVELVPP